MTPVLGATGAVTVTTVLLVALHCVVGLRARSPLTAVSPLAASVAAGATGSVSFGQ